jgi:hypothetical protein
MAQRSIEAISVDVVRRVLEIRRYGEEIIELAAAGALPPAHLRQQIMRTEAKIDSLLLEYKEAGGV